MKWSDKDPKVIDADNHILVVFKPSGYLTQPDDTNQLNIEEFAKSWVKEKYQKPGNVFLHAVHRLDKPVSGLVLFARTSKALSRLNEEIRRQEIERYYLAEVEGNVAIDQGRLEHFLVHDEHRALIREDGKKAVLFYEVISRTANTSLLRIRLETGRYHQIRAQLSAIGHPIIGDLRYGARISKEAIHLMCTEISFIHPVTKNPLVFKI